jgi:DNA-directed RNA polymerase subunit RPC12/RpoP
MAEKQFPCGQCGAKIVFKPGTAMLACQHCGHANAIPQSEEDIEELDFAAILAELADGEETIEQQTVHCGECSGETTLPPNVTAAPCAYCGSDIVATAKSQKLIKPKSLLPFKVTRDEARKAFREWVSGLWFAPNKLKQFARVDSRLAGLYVPYWTYDANTTTWYSGQRGDAYYVSESYTDSEGKSQTRQVRRVSWSHASGVVWDSFDDLFVLASDTLPKNIANKLEPWDLENLEPYQDAFLSGFQAESYHVGLADGFEVAKNVMDGHIRASVCRDIGGDEQRIHTLRTQYANVTFKHILLPIWLNSYRYGDKVFRFLVNGRTSEVQGERPWSVWKIVFAVLAVIAVIAAIILLAN